MYSPISNGQTCIGYAGAGVYASRLLDALLNLDIRGLPDSEFECGYRRVSLPRG